MSHPQQWFKQCYYDLIDSSVSHWLNTLPHQLDEWLDSHHSQEAIKLGRLIEQLPVLTPSNIDLKHTVNIGEKGDLAENDEARTRSLLKKFMPWRKGPFSLFGIDIDTEWRSDWKWERVVPHIDSLKDKTVLDVGCGSGYHMWRMLGEEAKLVIGIDPTPLFNAQFYAIKHFHGKAPIHMLPLGIEQMPILNGFDCVFSMGVLYHRRDPIAFLTELKSQLKSGGQLVLETLIVEGDAQTVLMPTDRYAQMRNVWFLPSNEALVLWLSRLGFTDIKVVDTCTTTIEEQRPTEWMQNQSLQDFLDPSDPSKTIEGYAAPLRSVITAVKR
ncbi:tRNA 5-methoxyuridine(34)/uridine 5-oxyacetic acid(34) synthase CmoB [Alteromonas facilis]|uniref:tRNA 5-methoxyuridine(34)/uridine 5-oxyacetic acid(34) synthase CmoB n=1 Tax=Alteromonas facilis TaxID=2048004 RepID=UPI000C289D8E|nr:tRNA 5-methoxyuridine(34)/uridine 5-oxyacetic acid(34) synthase CmoB [Alteromonas facilis]